MMLPRTKLINGLALFGSIIIVCSVLHGCGEHEVDERARGTMEDVTTLSQAMVVMSKTMSSIEEDVQAVKEFTRTESDSFERDSCGSFLSYSLASLGSLLWSYAQQKGPNDVARWWFNFVVKDSFPFYLDNLFHLENTVVPNYFEHTRPAPQVPRPRPLIKVCPRSDVNDHILSLVAAFNVLEQEPVSLIVAKQELGEQFIETLRNFAEVMPELGQIFVPFDGQKTQSVSEKTIKSIEDALVEALTTMKLIEDDVEAFKKHLISREVLMKDRSIGGPTYGNAVSLRDVWRSLLMLKQRLMHYDMVYTQPNDIPERFEEMHISLDVNKLKPTATPKVERKSPPPGLLIPPTLLNHINSLMAVFDVKGVEHWTTAFGKKRLIPILREKLSSIIVDLENKLNLQLNIIRATEAITEAIALDKFKKKLNLKLNILRAEAALGKERVNIPRAKMAIPLGKGRVNDH